MPYKLWFLPCTQRLFTLSTSGPTYSVSTRALPFELMLTFAKHPSWEPKNTSGIDVVSVDCCLVGDANGDDDTGRKRMEWISATDCHQLAIGRDGWRISHKSQKPSLLPYIHVNGCLLKMNSSPTQHSQWYHKSVKLTVMTNGSLTSKQDNSPCSCIQAFNWGFLVRISKAWRILISKDLIDCE